jgi:protein CpxP
MKRHLGAVTAVAVVLGLGLTGAVAAYAGAVESPGGKKAYRFISMKVDNALDDVKATDAQRQQVHQVKDDLLEQALTLKTSMESSREELKTQWLSQNPDRARVHQIVDQRMDVVRDFAHKLADGLLKIHDVLNADQRLQLSKQHEERQKAMHW